MKKSTAEEIENKPGKLAAQIVFNTLIKNDFHMWFVGNLEGNHLYTFNLSNEEREQLLKACEQSTSKDLHLAVVIALSTGARKQEVWNLSWNEIDLKNGTVIFSQTKNDEARSVPLSNDVHEMFREWSKVRRIDTPKIFPSKTNANQGILLERPWRTALKKAGIEDFKWHDLRHSTASYLAMSGVPMRSIAEILGHKTCLLYTSTIPRDRGC